VFRVAKSLYSVRNLQFQTSEWPHLRKLRYFGLRNFRLQLCCDVLLIFVSECHKLRVAPSRHDFIILVDEMNRRICQCLADCVLVSRETEIHAMEKPRTYTYHRLPRL
jgi:hypothetical protein